MRRRVSFRGPVTVYGHLRADAKWELWADPLGGVACGETYEEALAGLQESMKWLVMGVAELLQTHEKVHVFNPLSDELKDADRIDKFMIEVICEVDDAGSGQEYGLADLATRLQMPCNVAFEAVAS